MIKGDHTLKSMNDIAVKMKEIVDREGPNVLMDEPYKVYLELLNSRAADKKQRQRYFIRSLWKFPPCWQKIRSVARKIFQKPYRKNAVSVKL